MRAVMLLSGGLDSLLAARLMLDQGVELEALNFVTMFCNCTPKSRCCSAAASAVQQLGIRLKVINNSEAFLAVVRNPDHGYGSNLNPCIDCRILMFRKAADHMRETGASFLVTGEVLGERPMSQRRDAMRLIERESGLQGLIVRPLSAALLEPSIPEKEGWIDRNKLLAIHGRSRKPQIALAASYDLKDYPCPAGGCLLTDPGFAPRMRDLMRFQPAFSQADVQLLKVGRHFRLSPTAKVAVGRDESENQRLCSLYSAGDALLEAAGVPGPLSLLRGTCGSTGRIGAARVTLAYGKPENRREMPVRVRNVNGETLDELTVAPMETATLETLRIGQ